MCLPLRCVPRPYNNAYEFCVTCIAACSNLTAACSRSSAQILKPFDRRFVTMKNVVGVQSQREVDEVHGSPIALLEY